MTILTDLKAGIALAGDVIGALAPETKIAGLAIAEVVSLANAVADATPGVIAAWNDFKAARDSGVPPTPEEIATLKAAVDAAAQDLHADVIAQDAVEDAQD